jgi:hypothetical protein
MCYGMGKMGKRPYTSIVMMLSKEVCDETL